MIIDIHIHEKRHSPDSVIGLDEIAFEARRKGLDGICITDHDSNGLAGLANEFWHDSGLLVLVGAEILTYEGDILVFGMATLPHKKMHARDLIHLAALQGGVGIAAHPYRNNNRGLGHRIKTTRGLSGFEVLSGRTEPHNNMKAWQVALQHGLAGFGGSDAHELFEVGKFATYFPDAIATEADFLNAIRLQRYAPVFYAQSKYHRLGRGLEYENQKVAGFAAGSSYGLQLSGLQQER